MDETMENIPLPFPMDQEKEKMTEQQKKYLLMLKRKRCAVNLKEHGVKAVVTDYALDHWYR